jgi:DNA-binding beta-propeller fold protein YncE
MACAAAFLPATASSQIGLAILSQYSTGLGSGGAEISDYDPATKRLFVINGVNNTLDIVNLADPTTPALVNRISLAAYGAQGNSVAVKNGVVAVAVQAAVLQDPGVAVFLDTNGALLGQATVGALPDMVVFTPNGQKVLVANEGEPTTTYSVDPQGTVSIIDLSGGPGSPVVSTVSFTDFNVGGSRHAELPALVRIYGPGSTVAQDLEPEYIAVSDDGATAWVTLQEANAIAVIDVSAASVLRIDALGLKNYDLPGNAIDPSDQNGGINIANWPVRGMYQPDAIAYYMHAGTPYVLTANEGDAREYTALTEEVRVSSGTYALDPTVFPNAATLKLAGNIGRLTVTRNGGDLDNDGDYDEIWSLGGRSFSIWNGNTGAQVFDSKGDFESITSTAVPAVFNSNGTVATFDTRSDNKGPEPEGVTTGVVDGRRYAFVCLERTGGVMVYDVTDPNAVDFILYEPNAPGALAPEGVRFVSLGDSPDHRALLLVSNEVSGTLTVYSVESSTVAVTLLSFEATTSSDGVVLHWETADERDHAWFDVDRRDEGGDWSRVNSSPILAADSYTLRDPQLPSGEWVDYRLVAVDHFGAHQVLGELRARVEVASRLRLVSTGPNPFVGSTSFAVDLPHASSLRLQVFDAAGRLVRELSRGKLAAGRHPFVWDGRGVAGSQAPSGVYFLRAATDTGEGTLRLLRMRD